VASKAQTVRRDTNCCWVPYSLWPAHSSRGIFGSPLIENVHSRGLAVLGFAVIVHETQAQQFSSPQWMIILHPLMESIPQHQPKQNELNSLLFCFRRRTRRRSGKSSRSNLSANNPAMPLGMVKVTIIANAPATSNTKDRGRRSTAQ
jgi:hypothetical protein